MQSSLSSLTLIAVLYLTVGCAGASRNQYSEAGKSFSKGYDSASKIINEELESTIRVSRTLSVMEYLTNGPQDANINLNDVDGSFVRYVCAGAGKYQIQEASLAVLQSYGKMISDLSKAPSNEIGALWQSIGELRKPQKPLGLPDVDQAAYRNCTERVRAFVPPRGQPIEQIQPFVAPLAILGAFASIEKLIDALKKTILATLKPLDEAARAAALRNFVQQNRTLINEILDNHLADEGLKEAITRRERASVVLPYLQFKEMLTKSRETQFVEVTETAAKVHKNLTEFDALRLRKDPLKVIGAMKDAQKELERLADGYLTPSEAWAAFRAFADLMTELHEAVQAAKIQWEKTL